MLAVRDLAAHGRSIMSQYLFVYGTLLPELAPAKMAKAVARLKLVGTATIRGRLYDLGNYPGARLGGGGRIRGRVFEVEPGRELLRISRCL